VKKLVAQQESAKRALDFFVSVLRVTRANPCARKLPRVSGKLPSHPRATRRSKLAIGSQLGLVTLGRRISRAHFEKYNPSNGTTQSRSLPPGCHGNLLYAGLNGTRRNGTGTETAEKACK
jgi:hypothetical protein